MTINTATKASYQVLGARETALDAAAKEQAFSDAIGSIQKLLSKTNTDQPIRNVPQLVREIFDLKKTDRDLETIREVIRSNDNVFGLHKLSASGNKLLATLAIIQYPDKCFSADGKLRVAFTASVMRGWFDNGEDLIIDNSALQNFQKDPLDLTGKSIKLGKNRLAGIKLTAHSDISQTLENNKKALALGEQTIPVDLSGARKPTNPPLKLQNATEITGGDMHGNSKMLMHFLVSTGITKIKSDGESAWKALIEKIDTNDISGFRGTLPHCLELVSPSKNLVLLGDLLADRGQNDWFTLSILEFLHNQNQPFDIIFSNHDAAFVEYYLDNKNKSTTDSYAVQEKNLTQHSLQGNQENSLIKLNETLNDGTENTKTKNRQIFNQMTEKYLGHLKLVECQPDQRGLYSHGVVNDELLADLLTLSGLNDHQQDETGLQEKANAINQHFQGFLCRDGHHFRRMMNQESGFGDEVAKPFAAAIWNDGPKKNNRLKDVSIIRKSDHPYTKLASPQQFDNLIHGHTEDLKSARQKELNDLRAKITHAEKSMTESMKDVATGKKKAATDLFQPQWNFLRDAIDSSVAPKNIASALFSLIKQVEIQGDEEGKSIAGELIKRLNSETQITQEILDDIDKIFKKCLPTRRRPDYLQWTGTALETVAELMKRIQEYEEAFQKVEKQIQVDGTTPLQQAAEAAGIFKTAYTQSVALTTQPTDNASDQLSANDPVRHFISLDGSTGKSKNHLKGDLPMFAA